MKIKLFELSNILNSLNNISEISIPISLSYRLSKLCKKLIEEMKQYQESKNKLIKEYAEKDENDNIIINKKDDTINIKKDKLDMFQKEMEELNNIELEIDFKPIRIEEFGDINISPKDLMNIEMFIESDKESDNNKEGDNNNSPSK